MIPASAANPAAGSATPRPRSAALTFMSAQAAAARVQAAYMAQTGRISHTGAGGTSPRVRAASAGVRGSSMSENLLGPSRPDADVRQLRFTHEISDHDPEAQPGGCELGAGRCTAPAELEVQIPANKTVRRLCRDHVGWAMLGAASNERVARVMVRSLTGARQQAWSA